MIFYSGFKAGKNYVFAGYTQNVAFGFDFDKDLAHFAKYGFRWKWQLEFKLPRRFLIRRFARCTNDVFLGLQRSFMEKKLRLGVSAHQIGYGLGMRVQADAFSINSTTTAVPGLNNVDVNYDFTLAHQTYSLRMIASRFKCTRNLGEIMSNRIILLSNFLSPSNTTTSFTVGALQAY